MSNIIRVKYYTNTLNCVFLTLTVHFTTHTMELYHILSKVAVLLSRNTIISVNLLGSVESILVYPYKNMKLFLLRVKNIFLCPVTRVLCTVPAPSHT